MEFEEIPIIDVGDVWKGYEGIQRVATQLRDVYSRVGFCYLINHQIPQELVNKLFQANALFHKLPIEEKMKMEINKIHRGFIPINTSTLRTSYVANVTKPNQSESIIIGQEFSEDDPDVLEHVPIAGSNQWPENLPEFRENVNKFKDAMFPFFHLLISAIGVALDVGPDYFRPFFNKPTNFLRLFRYPGHPLNSPEDLFGSAPHSDYGFITLVLQDEVGGLQAKTPSGKWIDIPYMKGAFVMNSGDTLHRWSNSVFYCNASSSYQQKP